MIKLHEWRSGLGNLLTFYCDGCCGFTPHLVWCLNSCFSLLRNKRQTSRRVAWCVVCKTRGVINALPAFWGWAHTLHEPAVSSLTRCNIAQLLFHIGFLICSKFESSLVRFFNVFKVPRNTEIFLVQKFVSKQMKNSKTYRVFESTLSTHDKIIRCYKRKLIVFKLGHLFPQKTLVPWGIRPNLLVCRKQVWLHLLIPCDSF